MPTMTAPTEKPQESPPGGPASAHILSLPPEPGADDIDDPDVPGSVLATMPTLDTTLPPTVPPVHKEHEALLHGFCQALQASMTQWAQRTLLDAEQRTDKVADWMKAWVEKTHEAWIAHLTKATEANEHAQYQLSEALGLNGPPYQATVQARSPDGFQVTVTITKRETSDLVEDLERLLPWLKAQGYQA